MNTLSISYNTSESSAMLLKDYRRQQTSVRRVFYNMLKDEEELNTQFDYQKKDSILI